MPRQKKRNGGGNQVGGSDKVVRVSGSILTVFSVTYPTVIDTLVLNDSLAPNLATAADMFGLYRFTSLRFANMPGGVSSTAVTTAGVGPAASVIGFTPESVLVAPTTIADVSQMPYTSVQSYSVINTATGTDVWATGSSVPAYVKVARSSLFKTGVKWFRTQGRGTEPDWETQGTFYFAVSGAGTSSDAFAVRMMVYYTVEFCDQLPTSITLDRMRQQVEKSEGVDKFVPVSGAPGLFRKADDEDMPSSAPTLPALRPVELPREARLTHGKPPAARALGPP